MTRKVFSFLLLINCTWCISEHKDEADFRYLSYVAEGRKYRAHARSRSVSNEYSLYCQTEPECVCNREGDGYMLHCEEEVHAGIREKIGLLNLKCNATLPPEKLRHDYYLIMGLKEFKEIGVHVTACPEPPESYSSLFTPSSSISHGDLIPWIPSIKKLVIDCGLREQFSLTKRHITELNELEYFELSCAVLHKLPDDLFEGKMPSLLLLKISNTAISSIPDGLISSLPNLQEFILDLNRIEEIRSKDFKDSASLRSLYIDEPLLTKLENDIFELTPNLEKLFFKNSRVNVLPRSLGKLVNLQSLTLAGNKIELIEKDHCAMWEKISSLRIEDNPVTSVDFDCLFDFEGLTSIYITGTSLSKLPDKTHMLNKLRRIDFSKNTLPIFNASRFIESKSLNELYMDGSNIKSFDHDFLHSVPELYSVVLSNNGFEFLHEDFFSHNRRLILIDLRNNKLNTVPQKFLIDKPMLGSLLLTDNAISSLPTSLLSNCTSLVELHFGGNDLKEIPNKFLSSLVNLQKLNISNNKISKLNHDCFAGLRSLQILDVSNNILADSKMSSFRKLVNSKELSYLNLYGNAFSLIPPLHIKSLRYLNISNNNLEVLEVTNFLTHSHLTRLDLSRNAIKAISQSPLIGFVDVIMLDLSLNQLTEIPYRALYYAQKLRKLILSGNKIRKFNICTISKNRELEELDLSGNGLITFGEYSEDCYSEIVSLKKLDLSNNEITFAESNWIFDKDRKTWGNISPLIFFPNIEEIILTNNSISKIFIDWRNMLVNLRILDLRYNKIKYLTHQDILFTSYILKTNGRQEPVKCSHFLKIDLRHNLITGLELPKNKLAKRRKGECFANIRMLLEDNPFDCSSGINNVLQLFDGDIVLTSELQRTEGVNWILPAKIEPGNLSCWRPETVRGKKVNESKTWMHHVTSTLGVCSLLED